MVEDVVFEGAQLRRGIEAQLVAQGATQVARTPRARRPAGRCGTGPTMSRACRSSCSGWSGTRISSSRQAYVVHRPPSSSSGDALLQGGEAERLEPARSRSGRTARSGSRGAPAPATVAEASASSAARLLGSPGPGRVAALGEQLLELRPASTSAGSTRRR